MSTTIEIDGQQYSLAEVRAALAAVRPPESTAEPAPDNLSYSNELVGWLCRYKLDTQPPHFVTDFKEVQRLLSLPNTFAMHPITETILVAGRTAAASQATGVTMSEAAQMSAGVLSEEEIQRYALEFCKAWSDGLLARGVPSISGDEISAFVSGFSTRLGLNSGAGPMVLSDAQVQAIADSLPRECYYDKVSLVRAVLAAAAPHVAEQDEETLFEDWLRRESWPNVSKDEHGVYLHPETNRLWEGWDARSAHQAVQIVKNVPDAALFELNIHPTEREQLDALGLAARMAPPNSSRYPVGSAGEQADIADFQRKATPTLVGRLCRLLTDAERALKVAAASPATLTDFQISQACHAWEPVYKFEGPKSAIKVFRQALAHAASLGERA